MNFTFGIITSLGSGEYLETVLNTIEKEKIPSYEIIVVGGNPVKRNNLTHIPFDESIKAKWITKKKNLITANAKHENIVYLHDYVALTPGWYAGFKQFGNVFDLCMTKMLTHEDRRYRDWTLWAEDAPKLGLPSESRRFLLPYNIVGLSRYQYLSGAYWVAKKAVMERFPLDENLVWGEGEDVKWSKQVRNVYDFAINTFSTVKLLKGGKSVIFDHLNSQDLALIKAKTGIG